MKLTFHRPHGSLVPLPPLELPAFTLITGINGTGKTHLLRAIGDRAVTIEGIADHGREINYFDGASLITPEMGVFESATLQQELRNVADTARAAFNQQAEAIVIAARDANVPASLLGDARALARLTLADLNGIMGDQTNAQLALDKIAKATEAVSAGMYRLLTAAGMSDQIKAVLQRNDTPLALVDQRIVDASIDPKWGAVHLFQQSFARLFVAYRDLQIRNRVMKSARDEGDLEAKPLTKDEFESRYNIPPWDALNATLSDAGLDFRVEPPDPYSNTSYFFNLRKASTNAQVSLAQLSSGEKILMSLATCLYYARDSRQISTFPKVLLLDEVDAPLHPQMARHFLRAITETLVGKYGISVIATTHSATTVALADEQSLYVMKPNQPGLYKTTKNEALHVLMAGVPSLSIGYDGRRQVFVESETDARVLEQVYITVKALTSTERSLTFISAGSRHRTGDRGAGCDQVKRVVETLEKAGNLSTFGLIDWDGTNSPTNRVRVLAYRKRDGLENCLLDPLILACLVARDARTWREKAGLAGIEGAYDLKSKPANILQPIVDAIQSLVLGSKYDAKGPNTKCKYASGLELSISEAFLLLDDHKLEQCVFETIPPLRKFNHRSGALLQHIVESLLPDFPEFTPQDVVDSFNELLAAPT